MPAPRELHDYLMQIGHALNLVCELPEWLERAPLAKHLRHAAAESFAMTCRVLAEFLWSTGRATDIRAWDYCGSGWAPSSGSEGIRVPGDKHVAHMTADRSTDPLVALTYSQRCAIRDRLLEASDEFVEGIHDEDCAQRMRGFVTHARTLMRWPPPPTAGEDPSFFIEAIDRLPWTSTPE